MPIKMALRLCPDAKIIKGDMELFSKMSHTVTEVIEEKAPVMEKASIYEFYLDITYLTHVIHIAQKDSMMPTGRYVKMSP